MASYRKDPNFYNSFYPATSSTSSGSTYYNTFYDQYGVSDRERYYLEAAHQLQEKVRHLERMTTVQYVSAPLEPVKPPADTNVSWLRQRVSEITANGKLAAA